GLPSGGLPGGNIPSPSPGGPSGGDSPSGQSGSPSSGGGSGGGGQPSSYDPPPGGGGGIPGSPGGGGTGEGGEKESVPGWEDVDGSGDSDDWQTSNELPGDSRGENSQGGDPSQGQPGEGNSDNSASGSSGDDELDGALQDFDGEILAEREIIKSSPGASGSIELPTDESTDSSGSSDGGAVSSGQLPRRAMPPTPAPPRRGAEGIPDNIPDAKDDDIIARQLREAAMQELDPELQEKLWQEYRKYKKG
ncbi:MAG: hypothetical protein GXP16_16585, partial [Gammaproteobacteria bacterium]|nr:hypothetical protein [Gammaproteobacteria bacterium]